MAPSKKDKAKKELVKTAKGTRDWYGEDVDLLRDITSQITRVFRQYKGQELRTPVFEREEVLKGKYGEDSKLIYDLKDQGGELLSLRYDLTVPFARWLALNPDVSEFKRYAIDKVYRRDQPAVAKGRMREFYQCDIDFAGPCDAMIFDAEIISVIVEVFEALEWNGRYTIKINDRRILDGLFEVCGVPEDKIRQISSAVDKLDKMPWEEVKKEMVETKGLDEVVADKIGTYVTKKGGRDLLEELKKDEVLQANEKVKKGTEEMEKLMKYLAVEESLDKVSFDLSLARGLDYYTGLIYEVVTEGSAPATVNGSEDSKPKSSKPKKQLGEDDDRSDDPSVGVGSVAAGGRYDNLVERFLPGANMPCVGVSFGVDRIFSITKARIAKGEKFSYITSSATDVYVMAFGGKEFSGMIEERMHIRRLLRRAGYIAELAPKEKPKPQVQFKRGEKAGAPFAVILGEEEQARGEVRLKQMGLPEGHPEKDGVLVKVENLVGEVKTRIDQRNNEAKTSQLSV
ncbi:hypothetical protein B0A52_01783 [Exophiala mesophila]|uniref:histidine--tRNA ligase n=1 Tax=Exophiala mesophila TaxID=212818 RepID=A0A438NG22_EXOME|nr:hypothetical protein B0A52_01783 [Exophiala mesophila]